MRVVPTGIFVYQDHFIIPSAIACLQSIGVLVKRKVLYYIIDIISK